MSRLLFTFLILALTSSAFGQVVINEIQSSNGFTWSDEDGDNEDWIEVYNSGASAVDLSGYWLSDKQDEPQRWRFPSITLPAGETLLIWASGKDRADPNGPLHTNFSISAAGEELLLSNAQGLLVDELPPQAIPTDMSWGRYPDGADHWVFFTEPTPAASNTSEGYSEILEPPSFSSPGGFYGANLSLMLSHPDPEVTIIYSLDGSIPTLESLDGNLYHYKNQYPHDPYSTPSDLLEGQFQAYEYATPINVTDRSEAPNKISAIATSFDAYPYYLPEDPVPKATVVRARATKPGAAASAVVSQSYFVTQNGGSPHQLAVISLQVQEDHLSAYEDGIYVAGSRFDEWREDNPQIPADGSSQANWHLRGSAWERPAHLELFEPGAGEAGLTQDIGIRIHGGWSRVHRQKSLRLYARNAYSESSLNYPIFGESSDTGFRRLILRNSGNDYDYTLFRDAMIQRVSEGLRFDTMAYRPTHLYLNGEYWGIHNVRERYDRHYLARTHGVDPDNVDFLSNNSIVGEGEAIHYETTINYIRDNTVSDDQHFAYVQTRIDTDNFMDYTIANIYADNRDWPGNNVDYWRLRTEDYEPDGPTGHDGRWRWLMFDTDFGFGIYGGPDAALENTLAYATEAGNTDWPNPDWSTFLLRSLLANEGFRQDYINRFADLLNTHFRADRVAAIIEDMAATLEPDMPAHQLRWDHPWNGEDFDWNVITWRWLVNVATEYALLRTDAQREHITDYFGLAGTYQLTLNSDATQGQTRINSLTLNHQTPGVSESVYPWQGVYFRGVPIEVEALPAPGFAFSHWTGLPEDANALHTLNPTGDVSLTAHFVSTALPFLHAWVFDNTLANNTELETVDASVSYLTETGRIVFQSALNGYPETDRKASMERRNAPTSINYLLDTPYPDSNMRGLQVKQPFVGDNGENTLILELPTTGHSKLMVQFAAMDEGAADSLLIDYAINSGTPQWISAGLAQTEWPLSNAFELYSVDFSNISTVDDNPHFKMRIRFGGANMSADNGDRVTFNNFTIRSLEDPTEPNTPPANRHFADAAPINGSEGIITGNTLGAGAEEGEPNHRGIGDGSSSIWWLWQAPTTERMIFAADSNSQVAVYTGDSLSALQPVDARVESSGEIWFVARAGETYRIALASPAGAEGDVALTWEIAPPAAEPQTLNTDAGTPGIVCEMLGCDLSVEGTVSVITGGAELRVMLPEVGNETHRHHQQPGAGTSLWQTQFSGPRGARSRVIADMHEQPIVITEVTRDNGYQYQIEAHPSGLARHRILSSEDELLRVHLDIPGSDTQLNDEGTLRVSAPIPERNLRLVLQVSPQATVTARYQQLNGDDWTNLGDLLVNTEFPAGSKLLINRDQGTTRIQIETRVNQELSF